MSLLLQHLSSLPLAGSFGYLAAVYSIHSFMSHRQPVTIPRPVLVVYNAAQVVVNAYVAHKIAEPLGGHVWGIGLKDTPAVRYGVYLHMLCKYLDFNDTLIIVRALFCAVLFCVLQLPDANADRDYLSRARVQLLRKKSEQLSFLHLWHHATILLVWGWVVSTWPTAEEDGSAAYAYGAWINSIVHVVMYFYCELARQPRTHDLLN